VFSAAIELPVGTKTVKHDQLEEEADWTVNPDGDDDAVLGTWALGEPDFIAILGKVTQPAEDHSPGDGKLAFFTGPNKGQTFSSNDVDGGKTTLQSPVFALGDTRDPTLVFYAWHFAENLANQAGPVPVDGAELVVSASNDGGETWAELGKISGDTTEWTRESYRIRDALPVTNRMRFRFTIADTSAPGTVEAGIDDLEIIDYLESCPVEGQHPDAGPSTPGQAREESCTCVGAAAGADRGLGLGLLALGALLLVGRRRARAT
jgi:hypothetical protein